MTLYRIAAFWWLVSIALAAGVGFEYGRKVERAQVEEIRKAEAAAVPFEALTRQVLPDGSTAPIYPPGGGAAPIPEDGNFGCRTEDGIVTHEALESCQKKHGVIFPDRRCVKQGTLTVCYEN